MCIFLLLYNICLFDQYILYGRKGNYVYAQTYTWRHLVNKDFHNPINANFKRSYTVFGLFFFFQMKLPQAASSDEVSNLQNQNNYLKLILHI